MRPIKHRFVEYQDELYVIVGIGVNKDRVESFQLVSLKKFPRITRAVVEIDSILVPMDQVHEITDEKRLESIRVLYG